MTQRNYAEIPRGQFGFIDLLRGPTHCPLPRLPLTVVISIGGIGVTGSARGNSAAMGARCAGRIA